MCRWLARPLLLQPLRLLTLLRLYLWLLRPWLRPWSQGSQGLLPLLLHLRLQLLQPRLRGSLLLYGLLQEYNLSSHSPFTWGSCMTACHRRSAGRHARPHSMIFSWHILVNSPAAAPSAAGPQHAKLRHPQALQRDLLAAAAPAETPAQHSELPLLRCEP